jgi:hypothetical protein
LNGASDPGRVRRRATGLPMIAVLLWALAASGTQAANGNSPAHEAAVDRRGDHAMGFSHERTLHHFSLTRSGGTISAECKDPKDVASRAAIVRHFHHIAIAFKNGHFEMPMFVHDRVPPGVPEMKRLARDIEYAVEEMPAGARIVVTTRNAEALTAIHQFLKFQIEDHRTGDSVEVRP